MAAMRRILPLLLILLGLAAPAQAQIPLLPQAAEGEQAATATPPTDVAAQARALIAVLRDDTARTALLTELERLGTSVAPDAAAAPPAAQEQPTVGRTLALLTREVAEDLRAQATTFVNGLAATQRRLSLLWGPRAMNLVDPLLDLVWIVALTVLIYAAARRVAEQVFRGVEARTGTLGMLGYGVRVGVGLVVDLVAVLLAWAAGNVILEVTEGVEAVQAVTQTLYLNAFLVVEVAKVALAAVLASRRPAVRLVPLADAAARYWTGRLGILVSILGYGLLLAVPVVGSAISIFSARAVGVVIYAVVLLWAMALVVRHRASPPAFFRQRADAAKGDATLRLVAALSTVWHWPAMAYLLTLFVVAVSDSGTIAPLLTVSVQVVAVVAAGALTTTLLARAARHGISLPDSIREPLPLLEARVNGFLQSVVGALRFVIFLVTVATALRVSGLLDLPRLVEGLLGRDVGASLFSVGVIVLVAFVLWLALASWVDYRLNPSRAVAATARETTLLTLFRNAATIGLVVITLMVSLSELGLDIAPLLASAGVLGLAIGFGSQRLVQDIITGIFIQFENAINVGDVVTVGGTTGSVEKLTIRSVSLRDVNGVFHIIPFSSVDRVSNFMKDFSFHVADVGVAYRESVDEAKALMFKAFDDLKSMPEFARVIIGPLDWHGVLTLGDSAVTLRARIRTRPGSQWAVGRAYNEAVKRRFDEAGVEIPFPHMTLWFGQDKTGTAAPLQVAASVRETRSPRPAGPPGPISTHPAGQDAPNRREDDDGDDDPR